jgi:16S rRNA (uracil1498-N3)-methyltransferase
MSDRRFMINSRSIRNGFAAFDGDLFNHIIRVLRMGTGETLTLVDEKGIEHQGIINQVDREWVVIKITDTEEPSQPESGIPRITICQALPKGDKTDLILQKCTELGVHDFRFFGGKRSVARIKEEQRNAKLQRWNRIVTEAARQCERRTVPSVSWFQSAEDAADAADHELRMLLWENEHVNSLKGLVTKRTIPDSVIVTIGPEGGFDAQEVELFTSRDFKTVSLGKNILRTETASIAIMAILQYVWGD